MTPHQKPQTPQELKQRIYSSIDKLSDRATFPQSSSDLIHFASSLPADSLPTFLSCILTLDSSLKSQARSHCIHLLSLLATCHPPSSLLSHLPKILSSLLRRLRDSDSSVRSACVSAVSSLASLDFKLTFDSFLQCVSTEQESNSQIGGCLCLKAAIDAVDGISYGGEGVVVEIRKKVMPKVMKLLRGDGFKAKGALLGVLASVVGFQGGAVINGGNAVGSVVECAVEMLSCDDWGARKAAAEVLLVVGSVVEVEVALQFKHFVVSSLDSRRFDKVKVARETMNRAWEAWKEVPGGPDEDLHMLRSNSSISKDYGIGGRSPPLPRRSSFAGSETPKPKKTVTKTRSSLSDGPVATAVPSIPSGHDRIGRELPQGKKFLSKSRSSLSDDSTITDSSSVSRSSHDFGFETPDSSKHTSKGRPYVPDDFATSKRSPSKICKKSSPNQNAESRRSLDWKIEIAVPVASSTKLSSEDYMPVVDETEVTTSSPGSKNNFFKSPEEKLQKSGYRSRTCINLLMEKDESQRLPAKGGSYEEVGENTTDSEELSLIRNQLHQIERQQSNLLDLVQKFMGNSQNGIDSLETRVSGLERALDEISYDLAVQTGRIQNNSAAGNTCCPSTEFLSPKFWRRTDGRSSNSRSSCSGSLSNKDTNAEALQMDGQRNEQNEVKCRDSWESAEFSTTKSVKVIGQNTQRGRTCSPRSFDAPSTATCITPVVRGA